MDLDKDKEDILHALMWKMCENTYLDNEKIDILQVNMCKDTYEWGSRQPQGRGLRVIYTKNMWEYIVRQRKDRDSAKLYL